MGNTLDGIFIGGTTSKGNQIRSNTISSNGQSGIELAGSDIDDNVIQSNKIGTDGSGTLNRGNTQYGILVSVNTGNVNTLIGHTTDQSRGNIIAYNGLEGIRVDQNDENDIHLNSIFCNNQLGGSGKGIILTNGANNGIAAPVINGGTVTSNFVEGTAGPGDRIEIFTNDACCEGKNYVATVTANGAGNWSYTGSLPGSTVSATAHQNSDGTSELSGCISTCVTTTADAGPDDTICSVGTYLIPSANTTNTDSVLWATLGDGSFNDPTLISPTYTPGVTDISNGSVELLILGYGVTSSCGDKYDTLTLSIISPPDGSTGPDDAVCNALGLVNLTTYETGTTGGTWSGTGVTGTNFDPTGLLGPYVLKYIVGAYPCRDSSTIIITVTDSAVTAGRDSAMTLCNSPGSTLDLNTLLSGATPGGTWAETTIPASGQFNPVTGVFDASGLPIQPFTFTYSISGSGACAGFTDVATFTIGTISSSLSAGSDDHTAVLCNGSGSTINLNTLLVGANLGGTWTETTAPSSGQLNPGTGTFDGSGLPTGAYTFTYSIVGTGACAAFSDDADFTVTISDSGVSAGADNLLATLCNNSGSMLDLNTLLSGATPGGVWVETTIPASGQFTAGSGMLDGSRLTPGAYTFTYSVTGSGVCAGFTDVADFTITISDSSVTAGLDDLTATLCNNSGSALDLNTLLSGATPGGTWVETTISASGQFISGTGVLDGSGLTPGAYTFNYSISGTGACAGFTDVANFTVTISDSAVSAGADDLTAALCNNTGSTLDLNTLLTGATPGGSWLEITVPATGQLNPISGVFDGSGLTPGVYTFTYSVLGSGVCAGFTDVANFTVTISDSIVSAGLDGSTALCNNVGNTLDLNTLLSGVSGSGTWLETTVPSSGQFTSGTGILDASALPGGTYTFTYSVSGSGVCSGFTDVATFTISISDSTISAGADNFTASMCNNVGSTFDLNTLLSGVSGSGVWLETTVPASGQFNPVIGLFDGSQLSAGNYSFTYLVTGSGACAGLTDVANFTVAVSDSTVSAGLDDFTTVLCNNPGNIFNLNTLLSGNTGSGVWLETTVPSSSQFTPGTGVLDASGLIPGTYTFTYSVTGLGACAGFTDVANFEINITAPTVSASADNFTASMCNNVGSTLDLNTLLSGATPGGTWIETTVPVSGQFIPGTGVFDASGLNVGPYSFRYVVSGTGVCSGYLDTAYFIVTLSDSIISAGLDSSATLCNSSGSTLDLHTLLSGATPGGVWAETTFPASGQFDPITGILDGSGLPIQPYTFTYSVTGSGVCSGFTDVATFTIGTIDSSLTAGADDHTAQLCNGSGSVLDVNTLLNGANPGGTWLETTIPPSGQFAPGTGLFDGSGLPVGSYTFTYTITGTGACAAFTDDANFTVTLSDSAVSAGLDDLTVQLCNNSGSTLDLNTLLSGNIGSGTWLETTIPASGQFIPGTGVFDASGLTAGTYTFTYSVTGSGTCAGFTDVANFSVTISDSTVSAGLDDLTAQLCNNFGSTLDLNTLLSGNTGSGVWLETTAPASGQFNPITGLFDASGLIAGVYTFTYSVTGSGVCTGFTDVANFTVTLTDSAVSAGLDDLTAQLCNNTGSTLDLNTLLSGNTGSGIWLETTAPISGQFNPATGLFDASGLTAGVYTFTYSVTGSGVCSGFTDVANFTVTLTDTAVSAGTDNLSAQLCAYYGSTLDLNSLLVGGTPGGTWLETTVPASGQFTPGTGVFDASGLPIGAYTFTYSVTGSGACSGYTDVADFIVTLIDSAVTAGADSSADLCSNLGNTLDLNTLISGNPGGIWIDVTGIGSNFNSTTGIVDADGLSTGTYIFYYVVNGTGACSSFRDTSIITINVTSLNAIFIANPAEIGVIPFTVTFDITGSTTGTGITYDWDFGDGNTGSGINPMHTYTKIGEYDVVLTVSGAGLCPKTYTIRIITYGESLIFIPNVFTPNGDGSNDIFTVKSENLESLEGVIYNRWGQMMFQWDHIKGYWDGTTLAGAEGLMERITTSFKQRG